MKSICRDPKDDYLLALSKVAKADLLITADEDLLVLGKYGRTRIVTPETFRETWQEKIRWAVPPAFPRALRSFRIVERGCRSSPGPPNAWLRNQAFTAFIPSNMLPVAWLRNQASR